jgi:hypothetical protein
MKTTNQIWLMRFNDEYHYKIINNIHNHNNGFNISLLTGNKETLGLLSTNKELKKIDFVDNNKISALSLSDLIVTKKPIDSNFCKYLSYKYYYAQQIMERNERFSSELSFEERNYFIYKQVEFWTSKIRKNWPSAVVFMDLPHMYYEWVLMSILDNENIPYLIIGFTPNHTRMLFLDNNMDIITGYGGEDFYSINKKYIDTASKKIETEYDTRINNSNLNLITAIKMTISFFVKGWQDFSKPWEIGYYIRSGFFKSSMNIIISQRYRVLRYAWAIVYNRAVYNYYSISVRKKEKYVYVPLISGFENTLHPGSSPLNIVIILEQLSNNIPDDWSIYVKEHPAQFNLRYDQKFSKSKKLYKRIREINKVKLINISHTHHDLILNAEFISGSSMSSTAYQSIAHKKKIMYFGPDVLPREYAEPLFPKEDSSLININTKCYHDEKVMDGADKDAKSIGEKIIAWANNQVKI